MRSLAIDKSLEGIAGSPVAWTTSTTDIVSNITIPKLSYRTIYALRYFPVIADASALTRDNPATNYRIGLTITGAGKINGNFTNSSGVPSTSLSVNYGGIPMGCCWWDRQTFGIQSFIGDINSTTNTWSGEVGWYIPSTSCQIKLFYNAAHDYITRVRILSWLRMRYY